VEQTASIIRMISLLFIRFRLEIPPHMIVKSVTDYTASHPNKTAVFPITVITIQNVF
jgi:hypothetical protein